MNDTLEGRMHNVDRVVKLIERRSDFAQTSAQTVVARVTTYTDDFAVRRARQRL
jgi:hypothetical protein